MDLRRKWCKANGESCGILSEFVTMRPMTGATATLAGPRPWEPVRDWGRRRDGAPEPSHATKRGTLYNGSLPLPWKSLF